MADLIRRSYILKIIEMWMKVPSYSESERNIMRAIDYEVRTAPSAEAKKGRWYIVSELEKGCGLYKCSECNCVEIEKTEFCPNCGFAINWREAEK